MYAALSKSVSERRRHLLLSIWPQGRLQVLYYYSSAASRIIFKNLFVPTKKKEAKMNS